MTGGLTYMILKLCICALLSWGLVMYGMPKLIVYMKKISFNQTASEYSLKEYKEKAKTPIMGGLMFIAVPVLVTLVFCAGDLKNLDLWILILTFVGYGAIGFVDDWLIAVRRNNDGLKPLYKFAAQLVLAIIFYAVYQSRATLDLTLFGGKTLHIGILYAPFILLMFTGSSNAVNLTDGMDGLAAGCTVFALVPYMLFAINGGQTSIAVFTASLLGALIGFLHYNVSPAKIFMGDTGALALGAVLAALAMLLKRELSLVVIGGVFVIETLCVMIQIGAVKTIHKRVFPYTPIHYTFTLKGMSERMTVRMFWTVGVILAVIGYLAAR